MTKAIPAVLILALFVSMGCGGPNVKSRLKYVKTHPLLSPDLRLCILRGDIVPGMTYEDVIGAWGKPDRTSSKVDSEVCFVDWAYTRWARTPDHVQFFNGVVIAISMGEVPREHHHHHHHQ